MLNRKIDSAKTAIKVNGEDFHIYRYNRINGTCPLLQLGLFL